MSAKKHTIDSGMSAFIMSVLCSLLLVGVAWGNLQEKVETLEARVLSYESINQEILEAIRVGNIKTEVSLAKLENDVSWIKEKIANDK
tara:strand:- start:1147 stop:1410 length:264 start_codon:yes stop_codon:yes gene_type:complete